MSHAGVCEGWGVEVCVKGGGWWGCGGMCEGWWGEWGKYVTHVTLFPSDPARLTWEGPIL